MTKPLFIIGAGGFGREVFSIVQALTDAGGERYDVAFIDDAPSALNLDKVEALGSRVAGGVESLVARTEPFATVVAIGSNAAREAVVARLESSPVSYPILVHPDTTIGRNVEFAEGAVIAAGARLSTAIRIGRHVHVDQNAAIGHDVVLRDFCRLNPQSCVSGTVTIGERTRIGAAATVLQDLEVGPDATVGAGAVVVRNVSSGATVKGVPAR